jgi:hypothetical protein
MKSLNEKELSRINQDDLLVQLAAERLKVSMYRIKNLELSQKILSLELGLEKNQLETLRAEEGSAKINRAENLKILAKKKNLKEGWGFNPDSGEIIEN